MSEDDLVRRLQVGHDSGCAMSYGMHEHCCDCSYPCRQEAVEIINKLHQDLAAAQRERDQFHDAMLRQAADLAAARTLLKEASGWLGDNDAEESLIRRIDAALAGMTGSR